MRAPRFPISKELAVIVAALLLLLHPGEALGVLATGHQADHALLVLGDHEAGRLILAHEILLAELERQVPKMTLVTQNVDGLHQFAGSSGVIELHGNIMRSKCSVTHRPISREWLVDQEGSPPPSPYVRHGLARPDVVWFGEMLPQEAIDRATAIAHRSDFCFSIGTTSLVHPAAGLPVIAQRNGAQLVEINPTGTPISAQADQCLRGTATAALTAIRDQLRAALAG